MLDALPDALVVLDRDLRITDANAAYLTAVGADLADILGTPAADLLEPRDEDPGAGDRVLRGYAETLRTGTTTSVGVARYDFPDPDEPSRLAVRYWSVEVSPVRDAAGDLVGLVHRARDVTAVHHELVRALELHRELDVAEPSAELVDLTVSSVHTSQLAAALQTEVTQLREALRSRAGIEQAKGILMAQRGIGPDEAFGLLARLSQDTNRKLRDVAAAVVATVHEARAGAAGAGGSAPVPA